ncbi:MAG: uracil-DNA glycosylase [Runella sp.]|nr:MAG: uracil-DNA glycosylase [Runella sp.]
MDVKIESSWKQQLQAEFEQPYFSELIAFVKSEYATQRVYPPGKLIFNAFDKCPFDQTKVVILGQDPYHGAGQAMGLSFSVNEGVATPPSLNNIFKEIKDDLGQDIPKSGNLERWAEQGVLLLNGWEHFTDAVIRCLNTEKSGLVFMLWGKYAQDKGKIIDPNRHFVLKAKHPSPMAAFGTKHFSQANNYLSSKGLPPIVW